MSHKRQYKVTDDRFGRLALTLREKASLTQATVAATLGVSERAIRYWEDGTTFPTAANLKHLIAIYMGHGGFTPERERDEAYALAGRSFRAPLGPGARRDGVAGDSARRAGAGGAARE